MMATRNLPRLILVLGSTGTGKSKLALELAHKYDCEIISTDSMQVYKGLDIITNKVTEEERQAAVHHMIDFVPPLTLNYTVTAFCKRALSVIHDIIARNKIPILVGGTNYYIESLLWDMLVDDRGSDGFSAEDCPPTDSDSFATGLPEGMKDWTNEQLHARLLEVDPESADNLHFNNRRRVLRSLQVFYRSGRKHSEFLREQRSKSSDTHGVSGPLRFKNTIAFWLRSDLAVLDARLDKRVRQMAYRGLKEEICEFYDAYFEDYAKKHGSFTINQGSEYSRGIFQSIGFKEFGGYLKLSPEEREAEIGEKLYEHGITQLQLATRQYARRQIHWVKNRFLRRPDREVPPMFDFDVTNPTDYEKCVTIPAFEIMDDFLNERFFGIEPMKVEYFDNNNEERNKSFTCELCSKVVVGRNQFNIHLKSKQHLGALRRIRNREKEAILMENNAKQFKNGSFKQWADNNV